MHTDTIKNVRRAEELFISRVKKKGAFRMFMLKELPLAFLVGLKLNSIDHKTCKIDVPYRWINKNPFRSVYFPCLAMAGEMSTGLMAMAKVQGYKPSIALLVVGLEATFTKKATGITTFTCEEGEHLDKVIQEVISTGEARTLTMNTIGHNEEGEEVASFRVKWSFKQRSK
ncbi:MAG: DUF4442 domain-containing protein [Chitinophagales bacterium]|nr:DUF4442 domain-containing protein [Chitinophagales bacterium]